MTPSPVTQRLLRISIWTGIALMALSLVIGHWSHAGGSNLYGVAWLPIFGVCVWVIRNERRAGRWDRNAKIGSLCTVVLAFLSFEPWIKGLWRLIREALIPR
jgi:hypothetical protein